MVTATFDEFGQGPEVKYVTVYVPGVDKETSIAPVVVFKLKPPGAAEKLPPPNPVIVGVGSASFTQYEAAL